MAKFAVHLDVETGYPRDDDAPSEEHRFASVVEAPNWGTAAVMALQGMLEQFNLAIVQRQPKQLKEEVTSG